MPTGAALRHLCTATHDNDCFVQQPCAVRTRQRKPGNPESGNRVEGFDEITGGGIPRGRVTLLLGGPGAGKTVFAPEARGTGGEFGLSGILAGLSAKAKEMKASRIVFDGIDVLLTLLTLLTPLDDPTAERREMYRIYEWLQAEGLTGIITGKAVEADRPSTERYAFMQFMVD